MPLSQAERDNPLMRRYFDLVGLPGKRLAERCGVSHSQVYMARKRNVGADNAEKISRCMAGILGLSEEERLRLKAEIMGHPGELVRAHFGDARKAGEILGLNKLTASEVIDEKSVTPRSGAWALSRLRDVGDVGSDRNHRALGHLLEEGALLRDDHTTLDIGDTSTPTATPSTSSPGGL